MGTSRRHVQRLLAVAVAGAALVVAWLALAASAGAHASVVSSDPADGARLATAPTSVVITFDEPVGISGIGYLHVTDATGRSVGVGAAFHPRGDGREVAVRLQPGLKDSAYTESYRVISADTHPVAGTIAFVVGHGPLVYGTAPAGAAVAPVVGALLDASHGLTYAGLALVGAVWLVATVWPVGRTERRVRRTVLAGWAALVVGTAAQFLLQGPYGAGSGAGTVFEGHLLTDTLDADVGKILVARLSVLVLLALALTALFRSPHSQRAGRASLPLVSMIALTGAALIATFVTIGHASTTHPTWLSMLSDALHLLAMCVWLGGLAALLVAVLRTATPVDHLRAVLPVFSRAAFVCVVVIAVTGAYAAWRGIDTVHALTTTYALLIAAKVALFLGIVAVADTSRRHAQRAVTSAQNSSRSHGVLRRSVLLEAGGAVLVLGVTAVLVTEPRGPEALLASYREPTSATATLGGGASVTVTVEPAVHGPVDIDVAVRGETKASVALTATQHSAQLGPLTVPLRRANSGARFTGRETLPVAGTWDFDLVVSTSPLDAVTTDVSITLH